jgi:hypothetical protein
MTSDPATIDTARAPRALRIGQNAGALLDFVTLHRRDHYGPEDRSLGVFMGLPDGASLRRVRRFALLLALLWASGFWWILRSDGSVLATLAVPVCCLVGAAVGAVVLRRMRGPEVDTLRCIAITSTHVLVACCSGWTSHRILTEAPAGSLQWYELGTTRGARWAGEQPRIAFGGPEGEVLVLELPGARREALVQVAEEAGLTARTNA